jgi:hypothetical protein
MSITFSLYKIKENIIMKQIFLIVVLFIGRFYAFKQLGGRILTKSVNDASKLIMSKSTKGEWADWDNAAYDDDSVYEDDMIPLASTSFLSDMSILTKLPSRNAVTLNQTTTTTKTEKSSYFTESDETYIDIDPTLSPEKDQWSEEPPYFG